MSHERPGVSNYQRLDSLFKSFGNKENRQYVSENPHEGSVMREAFPCYDVIMRQRLENGQYQTNTWMSAVLVLFCMPKISNKFDQNGYVYRL